MTLTAGMVGHLTDSTMSAASVGDIAPYITWTRGQLVFDHVPVSEMLTTLGRWYGYDFHLTDSTIATRRVTTSFRTTTPEEVMPMLQDLLNVSASVDGPVITLRPVTKPSRRIPAPARRESRDPYSPLTEVGR
jgi:ferric-dicitrate binding protein FerR (iron transport regulator)